MDNRTLKDFFHGGLSPADRQMVHGSEAARLTEELAGTEGILRQALSPDLAAVLKRLTTAQTALNGLTAEEYYIDGFRTGARFMMEILGDTHENLEPVTE